MRLLENKPRVLSATTASADSDQIPPHSTSRKPFVLGLGLTLLLGIAATLLASLPGMTILGSLTIALLLGLGWRAILGLPKPYSSGVRFSSQKLLRYGIILTGVRLNFALIVSSGIHILLLDIILIVLGIGVFPWIMGKLGLSRRLAFLISVGQSICGASAVGAMAAVLPHTDEDDISLAVAICGLVGTVGVLIYTLGLHLFSLSPTMYGMLSGSTLHEIAQVVAAGPAGGPIAANLALVVKLTRVVLLAPIAIITALIVAFRSHRGAKSGRFSFSKVPMPWFVLGFLLVAAATSLKVFPSPVAAVLLQISTFLMVAAMAAMGLMVDLKVIRQQGMKTLGIALLMFAIFALISSSLILLLSHPL